MLYQMLIPFLLRDAIKKTACPKKGPDIQTSSVIARRKVYSAHNVPYYFNTFLKFPELDGNQ